MDDKKQLRKFYQKKFDLFKKNIITKPSQGWVKTIRDFYGMTTYQLAKKLKISQPRIVRIEKNEENVKISTMEKIADSLNCEFVYAFVPKENIENIIYAQAKKRAMKMYDKINTNMGLENQISKDNDTLEDIIQSLISKNIKRIWDEE